MKIIQDFTRFFNVLYKEYSKKNKGVENIEYTEETTKEIINKLNTLIIADLLFNEPELHFRLINFIHDFYAISKKMKFKDKYLKQTLDDLWYLNYWYDEHHEDILKIQQEQPYKYQALLDNPLYAKSSIDKYFNMLLSKTIDYIPRSLENVERIQPVIDQLDALKHRLNEYVDDGLVMWVYPFTENYHYMPFELRHMNGVYKLGTLIENWVDQNAGTLVTKYCQERGYDVFSGWGSLETFVTIEDKKLALSEHARKQIHLFNPDKTVMEKIVHAAYARVWIYMSNPDFDMGNPSHRALCYRTIATCIHRYSNDRVTGVNTINVVLNALSNLVKKTKLMASRTDRNFWFIPKDEELVSEYLQTFRQSRVQDAVSVVISHAFDLSVPVEGKKPDIKANNDHHSFLARSYNHTFHGRKPFTEEEVTDALVLYQDVLMQTYFQFTPDDTNKWVFKSSLEFWLNIKDEERVNKAYNSMVEWFSERHNTDLNYEFYDSNYAYFLYLSYQNKELLLDKLEKEPISIVNYGASKDVYDAILDILRKDINEPIMDGRVREVTITDTGICVG